MTTEAVAGRVVVDRYELLETLGTGPMGRVWRARDRVLLREVAVRQIELPDVLDDAEQAALAEKVIREAAAASQLDHPGAVAVLDVVVENAQPYVVSELVSAPTLVDVVEAQGPLPPAQVTTMGLELLDALRAAHGLGLVHRDVRPSNVLLTESGPRLVDFGVASMVDDPTVTASGAMPDPSYLAPEQTGSAGATALSDLWSLGATLYYAVEGTPPFTEDDPASTIAAIVDRPPRVAVRAGRLGPVLDALLVKDAMDRPDDDATRALLTAAASGAAPAAPTPAPPPPPGPGGMAPPGPRDMAPPGPGGMAGDSLAWTPAVSAESQAPVPVASPGDDETLWTTLVSPPSWPPSDDDPDTDDTGDADTTDTTDPPSPPEPVAAVDTDPPPSVDAPSLEPAAASPVAAASDAADSADGAPALLPPDADYAGDAAAPLLPGREPWFFQVPVETVPPPPLPEPPPRPVVEPEPEPRWRIFPRGVWVAILAALVGAVMIALIVTGGRNLRAQRPSIEKSSAPDELSTWVPYTDPATGFTIRYPADWSVRRSGSQTFFVDPSGVSYLEVDHQEPPAADLVTSQFDQEKTFSTSHEGYKRLQIERTTYQNAPASLWEFTYIDRGAAIRSIDIGYNSGRYGFALYFQARADDWPRAQGTFENFKSVFGPPA
ncbi:MAG: serine/threonine-protein kinase [Acidimicrobiales bacterium]